VLHLPRNTEAFFDRFQAFTAREITPHDGKNPSPSRHMAPLAGSQNLPFGTLVSAFGADFVVSEMVAAKTWLDRAPGTR